MAAIELQIDRHADEIGFLEARDHFVEQQWRDQRDELADKLANGTQLATEAGTVLTFGDVTNRLWSNYPEQGEAAMKLCAQCPSLGGRHMQRLLFDIAVELVEAFSDAFKTDLENDYEH